MSLDIHNRKSHIYFPSSSLGLHLSLTWHSKSIMDHARGDDHVATESIPSPLNSAQQAFPGDEPYSSETLPQQQEQPVVVSSGSDSSTTREMPPPFVLRMTAIAGLGGVLFGYDLGVIGAALPHLAHDFDLSESEKEWTVSILYVGALVGAILGGSICDSFGRKKAILITDILFMIGAIILFMAPTYSTILHGRVVVGFAVAVSGIADVSYLHEISEPKWRGSIVSVNEACISLGFLLAFAAGSLLSYFDDGGAWRIMFGLGGILTLVQLLGMIDMPESPKWLQDQGLHEESEAALAQIRGGYSQPVESMEPDYYGGATPATQLPNRQQIQTYDSFSGGNEGANGSNNSDHVPHSSFGNWRNQVCNYIKELYALGLQSVSFVATTAREYPRQGQITIFLSVTQQLCGQTSVLSYAPDIIASLAGDGEASSFVTGWTTVSIGIVKFLVTVIVIWKVDDIGRKPLLLTGIGTIGVGLFLVMIAETSKHGFIFGLVGMLAIVFGYSSSYGPLTWLLTSEIFPTDIRGRALGASQILNMLAAMLATSTFLSLKAWLGNTILFAIYLLITMGSFVFASVAIPETKQKTTAEIDVALDNLLWWRRQIALQRSDPTALEFSIPEFSADSNHSIT